MKVKESLKSGVGNEILSALVAHLEYSIADLNSWDELTDQEKLILPKDLFDSITEAG